MAYKEETLDRIRKSLISKEVDFEEKKMFMGVCIMVEDKMCCGTHIAKDTNEDLLFLLHQCRLQFGLRLWLPLLLLIARGSHPRGAMRSPAVVSDGGALLSSHGR